MQLRQGFALVADDGLSSRLRDALAINSGTVGAAGLPGYGVEARVPKSDWRRPTDREERILREGTDADASDLRSIVLVAGDAELLRLAAMVLDAGDIAARAQLTTGDASNEAAHDDLLAALGRYAAGRGRIVQDPTILVRSPNRLTLASDAGGLLGLHVDEWFDTMPVPRDARPGRIVVNLGRQARYLIFINIPVTDMPALIHDGQESPPLDGTHLGRRFMKAYPEYPVCRLRLDPGHGYIAPTENLVHDGSLAGTTEDDVAGHVLGIFRRVS